MIQALPQPQGVHRGAAVAVRLLDLREVFADDPEGHDPPVEVGDVDPVQPAALAQEERPPKDVGRLKHGFQPRSPLSQNPVKGKNEARRKNSSLVLRCIECYIERSDHVKPFTGGAHEGRKRLLQSRA